MAIDVIVVVLLVMAAFKGYRLGLIGGIFSYLALVIGLAAAMKLSVIVAGSINDTLNASDTWAPFLAFAAVFLFFVLVVKWSARLLESAFKKVMLGWLNRIGGVALFLLLYLSVFAIFLFYINQMRLLPVSVTENSQTYKHIMPLGRIAIDGLGYIIPVFKDLFGQLETFFSAVAGNAGQ